MSVARGKSRGTKEREKRDMHTTRLRGINSNKMGRKKGRKGKREKKGRRRVLRDKGGRSWEKGSWGWGWTGKNTQTNTRRHTDRHRQTH